MTYQLDDQAKAKKYEGKDVKVNGSYNTEQGNTIHVDSIEAAAATTITKTNFAERGSFGSPNTLIALKASALQSASRSCAP